MLPIMSLSKRYVFPFVSLPLSDASFWLAVSLSEVRQENSNIHPFDDDGQAADSSVSQYDTFAFLRRRF